MINPIEYINGTFMYKVIHIMNILNEHKTYIIHFINIGNTYKMQEMTDTYYKYIFKLFSYIKIDLKKNYSFELYSRYRFLINNVINELQTIMTLNDYINSKFDIFINGYIESYIICLNKCLV